MNDQLREAAEAVLEMHPDDNCPAHQALRAALAYDAPPMIDWQAVYNGDEPMPT